MKRMQFFIVLSILNCSSAYAHLAPKGMDTFNVGCPARELAPVIDHAYHECKNGIVRNNYNGCKVFVETFRKLLPNYDCQRPFDKTTNENYIVPAIWLVGDGEFEDYLELLSKIAVGKNRMYLEPEYKDIVPEAIELFISTEFRSVLDGHFAEEYLPLSEKAEFMEIKRNNSPNKSLKGKP